MVDDRPSENYLKEKIAAPERYAHCQKQKTEELRKENNRLFGRLLNIYEVSSVLIIRGALSYVAPGLPPSHIC